MSTVNMLQAKTQLSKLVEAVESGAEEEIVIARNGKPAARLVPIAPKAKKPRQLGLLEGKVPTFTWEEWKQSDAEVLKMFEDAAIRKEALWAKWEQEGKPDDSDDAPAA